jgi:hypothetical protein
MFFWISRWVSNENYNSIFWQELALVFQTEHQCWVIAYIRNHSSRLTAHQPDALLGTLKI